ncbi:MAG: hypothetical protein HOV94_39170 [Saccharothrix sp.]|nr:hypothetical protein [Saccharothrix sp.]
MPRRKPVFTEESAECRLLLQPVRPRRHRQIARDLLTNPKHPVSDKLLALGLDEAADGAVARIGRDTLATKTRLTDGSIREATTRLQAARFVQRRPIGSTRWEWRLLHRQPSSWLPWWSLNLYRSGLCAELPPAALLLWALAIEHTPSLQLQAERPELGPWCEVKAPQLVKELKISPNRFGQLVVDAAEAGLVLAVVRAYRPPIIVPVVTPVTRADRAELLACLMSSLQDRDGATDLTLHGVDAPTVWDDEDLGALIAPTVPPLPVPSTGEHDRDPFQVDIAAPADVELAAAELLGVTG